MPIQPVAATDLLAEVLALRPEIERILVDEPGCRNASCIEDKVQIVLFNIWRHIETYQPHADGPLPWVSRIAYHVKLDARRAKRRRIAAFGYESVDPDQIQHACAVVGWGREEDGWGIEWARTEQSKARAG
jgi:DNA-directed RNA polymerase specialized sigma24 family protein